MGIFTHVCIGSDDRNRSARFYDVALAPDNGLVAAPGNGGTIRFNAPSRAAVDAFHGAGLAHGGADEGAPGPRFAAPCAYGGYPRDPVGHKICAYIFGPDGV
jgi:hypothetical protein